MKDEVVGWAVPGLCRIHQNRYWKFDRFLFRRVPLAGVVRQCSEGAK